MKQYLSLNRRMWYCKDGLVFFTNKGRLFKCSRKVLYKLLLLLAYLDLANLGIDSKVQVAIKRNL